MELLHYSGDQLLTGTEIGRAVIDYAAALAVAGSSAAVEIPVRRPDGSVVRAHLLIGPASQLAAEPEVSEFPELEDAELVRELRAAIDALAKAGSGRGGRAHAPAQAGSHGGSTGHREGTAGTAGAPLDAVARSADRDGDTAGISDRSGTNADASMDTAAGQPLTGPCTDATVDQPTIDAEDFELTHMIEQADRDGS